MTETQQGQQLARNPPPRCKLGRYVNVDSWLSLEWEVLGLVAVDAVLSNSLDAISLHAGLHTV
jgi:hypothetical protein